MHVRILLQITADDGAASLTEEVTAFEKSAERPEDLGLSLAEGKAVTAAIVSRTRAARPSIPLRKSTGRVAIMTRTAPVGPITVPPSAPGSPPRSPAGSRPIRSEPRCRPSPPRCQSQARAGGRAGAVTWDGAADRVRLRPRPAQTARAALGRAAGRGGRAGAR